MRCGSSGSPETESQSVEMMRALIASAPNLRALDKHHKTVTCCTGVFWQPLLTDDLQALHVAAELDNAECVSELVKADDPTVLELRDKLGCTPLLWTAQNGADRAAKRLLEAGAEVEARMKGDWPN